MYGWLSESEERGLQDLSKSGPDDNQLAYGFCLGHTWVMWPKKANWDA